MVDESPGDHRERHTHAHRIRLEETEFLTYCLLFDFNSQPTFIFRPFGQRLGKKNERIFFMFTGKDGDLVVIEFVRDSGLTVFH